MKKGCRVALIGDYNEAVMAHRAIPEALRMSAEELGVKVEAEWLHTSTLVDVEKQLAGFDGIWCVPASPYANTEGALAAIRYAREKQVPFLGSCGGFQHAVIEYARNVLGMTAADHGETNPSGETLVIASLSCSLVEESEAIALADEGILREAYGTSRMTEQYRCSYGVNPEFQQKLFAGALKPTAWGASGEVRGCELEGHLFFVGTLFQSERRALRGEAPPLAVAFVEAISSM